MNSDRFAQLFKFRVGNRCFMQHISLTVTLVSLNRASLNSYLVMSFTFHITSVIRSYHKLSSNNYDHFRRYSQSPPPPRLDTRSEFYGRRKSLKTSSSHTNNDLQVALIRLNTIRPKRTAMIRVVRSFH